MLRELLLQHQLLVFRNVSIDGSAHASLVESLGIGDVVQEASSGDRTSLVTNAMSEDDKTEVLDGTGCRLPWHADYEWAHEGPAAAISLHAVEESIADSPTLFANMVTAAARLDEALRSKLADLRLAKAIDFSEGTGTRMHERNRVTVPVHDDPLFYGCEHAALGRHPHTGEEYLAVSEMFTSHVVGYTNDESDELFDELATVAYSSDNVYAHRWQPGDLLVWDNVALQHSRAETTQRGRRVLRRIVVDRCDLRTRLNGIAPDWEAELADRVRRYGQGEVVDLLSLVQN